MLVKEIRYILGCMFLASFLIIALVHFAINSGSERIAVQSARY